MSQLYLLVADLLIIAAGMAWAFIAGRHSIIIARHGWPHGTISDALLAIPFVGMGLEVLFVWLASAGRLAATAWLAAFSLIGALALMSLEVFSHFVGYR
jgi:hypothetical protein